MRKSLSSVSAVLFVVLGLCIAIPALAATLITNDYDFDGDGLKDSLVLLNSTGEPELQALAWKALKDVPMTAEERALHDHLARIFHERSDSDRILLRDDGAIEGLR